MEVRAKGPTRQDLHRQADWNMRPARMMCVTPKSLSEPKPRSGEELEKMNSDVENCSLPLS